MLSLGESTGTVASMQAELQVVEDRRQESYTSEPQELNKQQDAYSNSSNGWCVFLQHVFILPYE